MIGFVYKIVNVKNNKCYVGSTTQLKIRFNNHYRELKTNNHSPKFQNAWNKFGEENFYFAIIETFKVSTRNELYKQEQFWIDKLDSYKNGYNSKVKAKGFGVGEEHPMFGRKHSKNTILKMQRAAKLRPKRKLSEEHKAKISISSSRLKHSDETKEKLRLKNLGKNNPMFGKKASNETREKQSKALAGKTRNEETKNKMKQKFKGEGNNFYGKKHSDESKRKMREARAKRELLKKLNQKL